MKVYRFSRDKEMEFTRVLKKRVQEYFNSKDFSRNANQHVQAKTVLIFLCYALPLVFIYSGLVTQTWLAFVLYGAIGVSMALIGVNIMHDALHGAYSQKSNHNKLLGSSAFLLGIDPTIWHIQHNVLHHTYTNIEGADEDIQPRYVMRFSPHQPLRWFHRFQHIYAMFFYSISTLVWVFAKDFAKLGQYRKMKLIKDHEVKSMLLKMLAFKTVYLALYIVVPYLLLPFSFGAIILMFLTMHLCSGICLSLVFQPAHVTPSSEYIMEDGNEIEENWHIHQLQTTTNFGIDNTWLTKMVGGLNFQVEHHLFPNVCHVHYPALSQILQNTTKEFQLPYHTKRTFGKAIRDHFFMLRQLGHGKVAV